MGLFLLKKSSMKKMLLHLKMLHKRMLHLVVLLKKTNYKEYLKSEEGAATKRRTLKLWKRWTLVYFHPSIFSQKRIRNLNKRLTPLTSLHINSIITRKNDQFIMLSLRLKAQIKAELKLTQSLQNQISNKNKRLWLYLKVSTKVKTGTAWCNR